MWRTERTQTTWRTEGTLRTERTGNVENTENTGNVDNRTWRIERTENLEDVENTERGEQREHRVEYPISGRTVIVHVGHRRSKFTVMISAHNRIRVKPAVPAGYPQGRHMPPSTLLSFPDSAVQGTGIPGAENMADCTCSIGCGVCSGRLGR